MRTPVLPSTSLPPWFMNINYWDLLQWYSVQQQLTSLITILQDFHCSVCLTVFLHASLALSVLLSFVLYTLFLFNAPFVFFASQLLHSTFFFAHASHPTTTTPISSFFYLLIVSVLLLHPLRNASACSSCRVLYLFIIATFQLLWLFIPFVQHHWVL